MKFCPGDRLVQRVFFCSGAGGENVRLAACRGADAYLTGEMKHHEQLEAARSRLTCVAAGHYETERAFWRVLASYLEKTGAGYGFLLSQADQPPLRAL